MITASAPVRVCDNGGWTDTWFGGPGRVLNIAVTPGVEVVVRTTSEPGPVVLDALDFADRYTIVPGDARPARHPLLEAAIDAFPPPGELPVEVRVRSFVPPGSGTGTSASVAVAMVGALAAWRAEPLTRRDLAYAAHRLEVEVVGAESGIQDQLSAAFGGINYIEVDPYPEATVNTLPEWDELGPRLTLLLLGRVHDSSAVHHDVIEDIRRRGSTSFSLLREAAVAARHAVLARDLEAFGRAMIANTTAQQSLHPGLVGVEADRAITVAAEQGALGWKVNGAGGDGGSVTFLSATPQARAVLEERVAAVDPGYRVLAVRIDNEGLTVSRT